MQQQLLISLSPEELRGMVEDAVKTALAGFKQQAPAPKLLSRKEAAKFLGVSLVTLDQWEKDGKVKSSRIGSRVRYLEADLIKALK